MDMEPCRESATPWMSRYREGGFVGWSSRVSSRYTNEAEESTILMVMAQSLNDMFHESVGIF